jgi:hypothetical protein
MKIIVFIITSLLFFSCREINQNIEIIEEAVVTKIDSVKAAVIVHSYKENITNFITSNTANYDTVKFYSKTSSEWKTKIVLNLN